ncbi:IucA/IucC family siderophore biosynthesis protein [Thermoactinomyces sp. DSM 45892]|uniref:IucA/IucC family protein n=1 Tax=Thermoactinomyces sp. DSM 45892 TaxID=1882753 RepID=UPI00089BB0D8|nr:IucA/IucC family protein [Thermoactinomyces sp. DSM 45892]SDY01989.1 Siderophore synthetase component [Thermoactinomyces sp. DSM 45892]
MQSPSRQIARQHSMQNLLNCFLRETQIGSIIDRHSLPPSITGTVSVETIFEIPLKSIGFTLFAPASYVSKTGRHLFTFPLYVERDSKIEELDFVWLATLLAKEAAALEGVGSIPSDLLARILESEQLMAQFIENRSTDQESLTHTYFSFIEAEQSLIVGHLLHPTPKSRQGLHESEQIRYAPETKGAFALHYFRVHHSIVLEKSNLSESATDCIKQELRNDQTISAKWKRTYCQENDHFSIIPIHPLQAERLLQQEWVQAAILNGTIYNLGTIGRAYQATSSLRTLYHPESRFMIKGSVPIQITNSLRVNKYKELERGVEVSKIVESPIGSNLHDRYPDFQIITDPAFITVKHPTEEESGFEITLRSNPFTSRFDQQVTLIAGLGQDVYPGQGSRLKQIIENLAKIEQRSVAEVSRKWFQRYLGISLEPMLDLYLHHGIALEAHQQNSLVQLSMAGYPVKFFYRDNQGYYYAESMFEKLQKLIPDVSTLSQTMCSDAVADERFRYYLVYNHMFGLIQAFGNAGLIEEEILLSDLRERLQAWRVHDRPSSQFLTSLLEHEELPCKANYLTRFYEMDELVGSLDTQSIYTLIPNPLSKGAASVGQTQVTPSDHLG